MKNATNLNSSLNSLKKDFAAFRSQHRPHARIPDNLRRSVIEAISSGLEPSVVTSVLRISSAQLTSWRRRMLPSAANTDSPRILEVIPSILGTSVPTGLRVSYEAGRLLLELSF